MSPKCQLRKWREAFLGSGTESKPKTITRPMILKIAWSGRELNIPPCAQRGGTRALRIALFRMALRQPNQLRRSRQRLGLRAGRESGRPHQLDQSLAFRFAEDRAAGEALDRHVRMVLQRIRHCSLCCVRLAERGIARSAKDPGADDVVFEWKAFQNAQRIFISAVDEVRI